MKCKDCTMDCGYRTSDGEKECEFQNHIIQLPDEWQYVRIQASIAAMQGDYVEYANDEISITGRCLHTTGNDNLVDACVDMIEKLNELKML